MFNAIFARSGPPRRSLVSTCRELSVPSLKGLSSRSAVRVYSTGQALLRMLVAAWVLFLCAPLSRAEAGTYQNAHFSFDEESVRIIDMGSGYHQVRYDGARFDHGSGRAGRPELPVVSKWYILPDHSRISNLTARVTRWTTIEGEYTPLPIPESEERNDRIPDPRHYEGADPYPSIAAYVVKDHYFRGFHLAQILLYPVRYLPGEHELQVANDIDVSISVRPTGSDEEAQILRIKRPEAIDTPTRSLRALWKAKVVNPDEFDTFYPIDRPNTRDRETASSLESDPYGAAAAPWPSPMGLAPEEIVIFDDRTLSGESIGDVREAVAYFVQDNYYARTDSISLTRLVAQYPAIDPAESIHQYVRDAIAEWGTLYFLLFGDLSVIPTRRLGAPDFGDHTRMDPPSDIYYMMHGDDWDVDDNGWFWEANSDVGTVGAFPQATVGRLPVRNVADAWNMVSKTLSYSSREASDPDFFETATLISGPAFSVDPTLDICGYKASEQIRDVFLSAWPDTSGIVRLYGRVPGTLGATCNGNLEQCYESLDAYLDNHLGTYDYDENEWDEFTMFEVLDGGSHFIWHAERGQRDKLAGPAWDNDQGSPWLPADQPCSPPHLQPWQEECADLLETWATSDDHWHAYEPMTTSLTSFMGPAYGKYSIVMSVGWSGGATDQQSIGEALLQASYGGSVAFIGKAQNTGVTPVVDIVEGFLDNVLNHPYYDPRLGTSLTMAILDELGSGTVAARWASLLPLLGDPGMVVWPSAPGILHATLPGSIGSLGAQSISITVREDDAFGDPIQNAVVTLRQGDLSWARVATNASGVAEFPGFAVLDTTDIQVRITARAQAPLADTLVVSNSAGAHLAYEGHLIDDSGAGGDGDGVLETGEAARIRVVWRNKGTTTATGPNFSLRPSPPVVLQLTINGEFRPEDIHIGKEDARPVTAAADSFRIPLTWEGFTIHGEPSATLSAESFKVWRENSTGRYVVAANSPSASADSVFTGILKTMGGFSDVSMTGEGGTDQYYASADSIWFSFKGDASEDRLYFRAQAVDWIGVTAPSQLNPNVAAGDTLGLWFGLDLLEDAPDQTLFPFTATAQHNGTVYAHSDFSVELHGPLLDLLVVEWEEGGTVNGDTTVVIRPTLRNLGSAEADSAVVIFRLTGGSGTALDTLSTFTSVEAAEVSVPGDSIVVAAADSAALANLEYELEVCTLLPQSRRNLAVMMVDGGGGGGGGQVLIPQNVVATPEGRAIRLRWDPVQVSIPGGVTDRYLVYLQDDSQVPTSYTLVGEARGSSTFEVHQIDGKRIEPLDESGDPIDYEFVVRACNDVYCGPRSDPSEQRPWLPEMPGYPTAAQDLITTAPLVVTIGERDAVFVAGRAIWAWWLDDGTPLHFNNDYCEFPIYFPGLFYFPEGTYPVDDYLEGEGSFAESLVRMDLPGGEVAIVGNIANECVYAVKIVYAGGGEYCPDLLWKRCIRAGRTAPTVAQLSLPSAASDPVVIVPGRQDTLYVFAGDDGTGWIDNQTPDGAYAINESSNNIRSVAILPDASGGGYIVQAERGGRVVVWETASQGSPNLVPEVWVKHIESPHGYNDVHDEYEYSLSTPAVGDVDGDDEFEIVVTDQSADGGAGTVFVLDGSPADTLYAIESQSSDANWEFLAETPTSPANRPALACLDGSADDLEIVVSGAELVSGNVEADTYRLHVLEVDGSTLDENAPCTEAALVPYRSGERDTPAAGLEEPVVVDLDGDGSFEILMGTVHGDVAAWSYDESEPECLPVRGWPIHLYDSAFTPRLTDEGILISSGSTYVHYFRYPDGGGSDSDGWVGYGNDDYNTGVHYGCASQLLAPEVSWRPTRTGMRIGPVPARDTQKILLNLEHDQTDVELSVFDVQGRRVREIVSGSMRKGLHVLDWSGVDESSRKVASGVYFYQLRIGGEVRQKVRTIVMR